MRALLVGCLLLGSLAVPLVRGESLLTGDLPRQGGQPLEQIPGLDSIYGVLKTRDGVRLRTILTKPVGMKGRLPSILFVQWLSCDSIELPASSKSGWSNMMRRVAQESGMVMMRTEKRGVGDSEGGPCSALDYDTELSDHRQALEALRASEFVDPARIVIFGASMGGTYAPLVALRQGVAGIVVWGAGARTWFERMLLFERNYRDLSGKAASNQEMKEVSSFLYAYLVEKKSPQQIAAADPKLGAVWSKLVGTEGNLHYGRPLAFHQQAQEQDWAGAWAQVRCPVLVLYGEYDWYESPAGAEMIARIVNRARPGSARFALVPGTDHHFESFARAEDAVSGKGGRENSDPVVREVVPWLRALAGGATHP